MNFDGNTRQLARKIVDDFTYELHHSIGKPQLDFSRVPQKVIVSLIDHVELVIKKAMVSA